jgi:hypothetical protein
MSESYVICRSNVLCNEQLAVNIFTYLQPFEICNVTECCKLWYHAIDLYGHVIWSNHIKNIWKETTMNNPYFNSRAGDMNYFNDDLFKIITVMDRLRDIDITRLQVIISKYQLTPCSSDYCVNVLGPDECIRRIVLAIITFNKKLDQSSEREQQIQLYHVRASRYLPLWIYRMNPYKATYIHSIVEIRSRDIYKSELIQIEWLFEFKDFYMNELRDYSMIATFSDDYRCSLKRTDNALSTSTQSSQIAFMLHDMEYPYRVIYIYMLSIV